MGEPTPELCAGFRAALHSRDVAQVRAIFDGAPQTALELCGISGTGLLVLAAETAHVDTVRYVLSLRTRGVVMDPVALSGVVSPPRHAVGCALLARSPETLRELLSAVHNPFETVFGGTALLRMALGPGEAQRVLLTFLLERLTLPVAQSLFAPHQDMWNPLLYHIFSKCTMQVPQRFVDLGGSVFAGTYADFMYLSAAVRRLQFADHAPDGLLFQNTNDDGAALRWLLKQPRLSNIDGKQKTGVDVVHTNVFEVPQEWVVNALLDAGVLPDARKTLEAAICNQKDRTALFVARREGVDLETPFVGSPGPGLPHDTWSLAAMAAASGCPATAAHVEAVCAARARRWSALRMLFSAAVVNTHSVQEGGVGESKGDK